MKHRIKMVESLSPNARTSEFQLSMPTVDGIRSKIFQKSLEDEQ